MATSKTNPAAPPAAAGPRAAAGSSARTRATGRWSLLLCLAASSSCTAAESAPGPQNVTVEVSPRVGTVAAVRWSTEAPSVGYVEFGTMEALDRATAVPSAPEETHVARLLSLHPDTEYAFRVVTWTDENAAVGEVRTFRTDPLPPEAPDPAVEGDGHDLLQLVPVSGTGSASVVVIDPAGEVVWHHTASTDEGAVLGRARLASDGSRIAYNLVATEPTATGQLVSVALDGEPVAAVDIEGLGLDFVAEEPGVWTVLASDVRDVDGESVAGDQLLTLDAEGRRTTVWSTWDCFDDTVTAAYAVDLQPGGARYHVGLAALPSIVEIEAETGTCSWILGSDFATLAFADGAEPFVDPGQFAVEGTRVLVVDRGPTGPRLLEYELDLEAGQARQSGLVPLAEELATAGPMEALRLPGNAYFVSGSDRMQRIDQAGAVVWSLSISEGGAFGYPTLVQRLDPGAPR